jgi:hypothetical protein
MANSFKTSSVIPSVLRVGKDGIERYVVTDQTNRFWTGSDWTKPNVRKRALLFNTAKKAHLVCDSLLVALHGHLHHTRFQVPFKVQLWTNKRGDFPALQAWIRKNTKLFLDTSTGIGPVDGSYATTRLDHDHLIEIPSKLFPTATLCIPTEEPAFILSVVETGTPTEPSWCVTNQWYQCLHVDGDTSGEPTSFRTLEEAFGAVRGALDVELLPPARTLQAPLYVDLYSPEAVDTTTLHSWLAKAVMIVINGGTDTDDLLFGAVGMCHFDFAALVEIT